MSILIFSISSIQSSIYLVGWFLGRIELVKGLVDIGKLDITIRVI
jgi:hypothetical protein